MFFSHVKFVCDTQTQQPTLLTQEVLECYFPYCNYRERFQIHTWYITI